MDADGAAPERGIPATVTAILPQGKYRLELDNRDEVLAHAVGASQANFLRIRPGDKVRVELSPHDKRRGRIVRVVSTV